LTRLIQSSGVSELIWSPASRRTGAINLLAMDTRFDTSSANTSLRKTLNHDQFNKDRHSFATPSLIDHENIPMLQTSYLISETLSVLLALL
jgi:hypothetical protein